MNTQTLIRGAVAWASRQAQRRAPHGTSNRHLAGAYAPVAVETTGHRPSVRGHIPRELNGVFARIGPNAIRVQNPAAYHWFLGDGMVHGVRLADGAALWYRNRWIGTDSVNRHLGRPRAPGARHGVSDAVNTNVIGHAGRLWALTEAGVLPVELDRELNTVRHGYFDDARSRAYTAHPHRDPRTGELHAVCYDALSFRHVRHVVVDRNGAVIRDVSVPVKHGPMIHDCALTAHHVVLFDLPVTFSVGALLRGAGLPYQWNRRHPARVGLLPRNAPASAVRWFELDPCYVFHAANAFELDDGAAVVDVIAYPRLFDRSRAGQESSATQLERWRLDGASGRVHREILANERQEFPRFDERRATQRYRYVYTVGFDDDAPRAQPLYRHDLQSGQLRRHDFGPSHLPSEAVFVPRESGAEDDGWLLSYVYDLRADKSQLVILNAQDLDGEPEAIIHLPVRVPMGFHGNWIAD